MIIFVLLVAFVILIFLPLLHIKRVLVLLRAFFVVTPPLIVNIGVLITNKVIISRHVIFDEFSFPNSSHYNPKNSDFDFLVNVVEPSPAPPLLTPFPAPLVHPTIPPHNPDSLSAL